MEPSPKGLKRRRSGHGMFQLAETVDAKDWESSSDNERELTVSLLVNIIWPMIEGHTRNIRKESRKWLPIVRSER